MSNNPGYFPIKGQFPHMVLEQTGPDLSGASSTNKPFGVPLNRQEELTVLEWQGKLLVSGAGELVVNSEHAAGLAKQLDHFARYGTLPHEIKQDLDFSTKLALAVTAGTLLVVGLRYLLGVL